MNMINNAEENLDIETDRKTQGEKSEEKCK